MSLLLKALDYVYLTRPILFFPGWTTLIAGYFSATGESHSGFPILATVTPVWWSTPFILSIFALGCTMGGGAILNQLKDMETDQKNKKLFILVNKFVPISHAYIESIILLISGLLIAIKLGWSVLGIMLAGILIAGYVYNFPPFNLKNSPIGGLWANMMMGWLVFVFGWVLIRPANLLMLLLSLPYLFYNTALYLLTTLPDMEGDIATQKITFPVKYGFKNTLRISFLLYLLTIIGSVLNSDGFLFPVTIAASPFFLRALIQKTFNSVVSAVKFGIFFFSLGICVKFLPFLGMIVLAFFVTRYYYNKRFGIKYPTFKGV